MISINWEQLYAWPGYDFWGVLLSVIGFASSVAFAATASSRAKVAAEAANKAKRSMTIGDASSQLTLVQQFLVEVRLRVEGLQWEQVSEKCETIRVTVAPLVSSNNLELTKDTEKALVGLQSQMANLQKTANEIRHNDSEFDLVKIKGVLSKQAEAVARAVRELKDETEVV